MPRGVRKQPTPIVPVEGVVFERRVVRTVNIEIELDTDAVLDALRLAAFERLVSSGVTAGEAQDLMKDMKILFQHNDEGGVEARLSLRREQEAA